MDGPESGRGRGGPGRVKMSVSEGAFPEGAGPGGWRGLGFIAVGWKPQECFEKGSVMF